MKKGDSAGQPPDPQLRAEAERQLAAQARPPEAGQSIEQLLYELQVHQIELEMQNEALRQARNELEASRDRYVDLYDFAPVGYLTLAANGQITDINLTGAALLGRERKRLLKRRFDHHVSAGDRDRWQRLFLSAKNSEMRQQCELALQRGDGTEFHAGLECLPTTGSEGTPTLRVTLTDISERRHAEEELRIAAIAFESQQGMFVTDGHGVMVRVNQAFSRLTGYPAGEVLGSPPVLFKSKHQDEAFYQHLLSELRDRQYWQGEIWSRRKDGSVFAVWLTVTAVPAPGGEVNHYVGAFSDITLNKEAEAAIQRLAFYDPLTRLPNRRLFYDRLGQVMAASRRDGRYGALLFLDLDKFKLLNDSRGHDVGDQWLIEIARRLLATVRKGDTVARLAGDEFVVLLQELSDDIQTAAMQADQVGESVRAAIARPHDLDGLEYQGGSSIGIALFHGQEVAREQLLKHADLALYQAKAAGRNRVRIFEPGMQQALDARSTLEEELRQALEQQQLQLHYQPQTDEQRRVVGAEVLLRWNHPVRGLMSYGEFLHLAEDSGLILPIGQWVLANTCAQLKAWQASSDTRSLRLSINVSPRQFHRPDFVNQVQTALDECGAAPDGLMLEISESTLSEVTPDTRTRLQALKTLGISFTLDNFGSGLSSLSQLQRLPLDQLKMDRTIVRSVAKDSGSAAIVRTFIATGMNLGLKVIAEGVEDEAQLAQLRQFGCTVFQGYMISRPLPLEAFESFLRTHGVAPPP